jgi:gliding motility-associated-like protein
LSNTTIPNPQVINPTNSVLYTLTVRDILGCPKPVQKIVKLNVVKINANAGPRDTSVVLGQPLQLFASGGTDYLWLPDNRWLSSTIVPNPIALPQSNIEYIVQVSDVNGCFAFDSIRVRLFTVKPGLYVPNAFTPNGDNNNDFFRPIALGIKSLDLFQVYNRWGQMVYSNTDLVRGWDGTFGGRPQDPATFVWIAEATDYTGKKIKLKGTVVLIRQ